MRSHRNAFCCAGLAIATLSAIARADNSPLGVWIDHTGRGAVEITDCNGKLCGRIAWVKDAEYATECGKEIIGNVEPVGKNQWDNGWIYDPDRGSKYDVELTALDNDKLRVKGYAGTKWLSETHVWKRAPADLQKCAPREASHATRPEAAKSETTAKLDAAKSATDGEKPSTSKSDGTSAPEAKEPPKPDEKDANTASDERHAGKGEGRKLIARIMEGLESGDGPVKLKRSGKTCRLDVPYVVVSFPCDKDKASD